MANSPMILVVEDDREISALFDLFLEQRGYRPLIANDAVVGGEILRAMRPHLMIADVMAGCGSGANVVALAQQAGVPVLLMSGDPAAIEARLDGPVPFLEKPFGLAELERAIDGLLAGADFAWETGDPAGAVYPPESHLLRMEKLVEG